jgi:hypothetical protein
MYTHFRGSTFQFIGQLQDDGVPQDMTNCTLQANVYDPSGTNLYGTLVIGEVDFTQGLVTISYPDTSKWPVGKARIDFRYWNANGDNIISPPDWFRVAESPLVQ